MDDLEFLGKISIGFERFMTDCRKDVLRFETKGTELYIFDRLLKHCVQSC